MKTITKCSVCVLFFLLLNVFCITVQGSELYKLIPRNTEAVIRADVFKIQSMVSQQEKSGEKNPLLQLSGDLSGALDLQKYCSESVISAVSLRKSHYLVFCKSTLKEQDFLPLIRKTGEVKVNVKKQGTVTLYEITSQKISSQTIYASFLPGGVILLSENDPSWYFLLQPQAKGLTDSQRSWIKKGYLLSGFAMPDKKFYRKNPMLPRFRRMTFQLQLHKDGALSFFLQGILKDGEDAARRKLQLQQTLMVAALFLENIDPSLGEDLMKNGSFHEAANTIYYRQYFNTSFIERFCKKVPAMISMGKEMAPVRKRKAPQK